MLMRIVARLLALADIADGAAKRSLPVRWLVMWYLANADAVVRDFVADYASHVLSREWSPSIVTVRYGHAPADALNLAAALRALARIVYDLAVQLALSCLLSSDGHDIGTRLGRGRQAPCCYRHRLSSGPARALRRCRDPTPPVGYP